MRGARSHNGGSADSVNSPARHLRVFTRSYSVISRNQEAATAEALPDLQSVTVIGDPRANP